MAATVHLGLLVHWVQSAAESDVVLLGPTAWFLGAGGGLPSGIIVLGWEGQQFGLKNTCFFFNPK